MQTKVSIEKPEDLYEKARELCKDLNGKFSSDNYHLTCEVDTDKGKLDIIFYPMSIRNTFNVKYMIVKDGDVPVESSIENVESFHLFEGKWYDYNVKTLVAIGPEDSRNELELYYKGDKIEMIKIRGVGYYKPYKHQKSEDILNMYNIKI